MLAIAMTIFGIYALIAGKLGSKTHQVLGWKARLIGVIMLAYFPIAFMMGLVFVVSGILDPAKPEFQTIAMFIDFGVVIALAIIAGVLYSMWKQPVVHNPTMAWPQGNQPTHFSNQPLDPNNPYATGGSPPPNNPFADRQ